MVSVLTFYSDDPSLNITEIYNFYVKLLLKRTKINILPHLKIRFHLPGRRTGAET